MNETKKKVLLVLGASSDVGQALISCVASEYDVIWAHYNRNSAGVDVLKECLGEKLLPLQADFSKRDKVEALAETIISSGLCPDHIVHLPASKCELQNFHKTDWGKFQQELDVSLRSIVLILQKLLPPMLKKHSGKILFMLSSCVLPPHPSFLSYYIVGKYALLGLMNALACEYSGKGILINAISPEMITTKFLADIPELVIEKTAIKNPLKRNLNVQDVIQAFRFFLSDAGDTLFGQNLGIGTVSK